MNLDLLRRRARLVQSVRHFFVERDYLEVDTPAIAPALIPEPSLEVFRVEWIDPGRDQSRDLYLIPSPEVWMKRLLAAGCGSVFQICKAFRNFESIGRHHNPEFTMLEWYTVGSDYRDSMTIMEALQQRMCDVLDVKDDSPLRPPLQRMTMRQAFQRFARVDLSDLMDLPAMADAARSMGLRVSDTDTWEQVFHLVLVDVVEPCLPDCLFLTDWPSAVPTLARSRGPYSERWELYLSGVEVANCYTEEASSEKVDRFFSEETDRKRGARVSHRIDASFPRLFERGFPACSGVALGIDRWFMVLSGLNYIDSVLPYSFLSFREE